MPRVPARRLFLIALSIPLLGSCSRGVAVESEPGPAYVLEVNNPMPQPMIVSYDDGTGTRLLGTVSANSRGRFVITRPANLRVVVTATDESRTRTVTRQVVLRTEAPAVVDLMP